MQLLAPATRCGSLALGVMLLIAPAQGADDPLIDQLRTDVRTLEREVRELSRRIDQLQQDQPAGASTPAGTRLRTAADPDPGVWLAPEKWDRIKTGMSAQQVILVLGTPVSMRAGSSPGIQTLFYTLPIGDGGFLTGTVHVQDDKVMAVQKPVLKPGARAER